MIQTSVAAPDVAVGTVWRCGGRQCGAGECEHDDDELHRTANGTGPSYAPPVVHAVLRSPGTSLPAGVRRDFERTLGQDLADVRIHTDDRAAASARAVSAQAYTVGRHVVFAADRFDPSSGPGRALLAHELTHAAAHPASAVPGRLRVSDPDDPEEVRATGAERAGVGTTPPARHAAPAGMLWRTWESAPAGACSVAPGQFLRKVVVDQEKAQQVTLHWNDGSVEAGMCSTGKGHCCTDTTDGVAGTVAESRRDGSNLTPITTGAGHPITDRFRQKNGWHFWSTFVAARGIGLHQHHTVTGTPLSHGCVRLHEETAQRIFCGAVQNQTRVEVRGYSRPDCAEPELRREWEGDFRAARVTDGEQPSADVRETRRVLRESYGRDLSAQELAQGPTGTNAIPRCRSRMAAPTVEEQRGIPESGAATGSATVSSTLLASSGLEALLPALTAALAGAGSLAQARTIVRARGQALWEGATGRTRGIATGGDDRALYWARLAMTRIIHQWEPRFRLADADREDLVRTFEDGSRGFQDIRYGARSGAKRILISGFDPFGFDLEAYGRGAAANPSAAAALALDGVTLSNGSARALVQSVVFPVRFADFDAGVVERVIRPHLSGSDAVDMVMTISMGAEGSGFEVEEYAGRRRSGGTPDDADATSTGEPPGLQAGPEFLRTSLPASARRSLGRTTPNDEERRIVEIRAGETTARSSLGPPARGSRSVSGSGGGYLSNEIFYRVALMKRNDGSSVPVGHLHTPFLTPSSTGIADAAFVTLRASITAQARSILEATIPDL